MELYEQLLIDPPRLESLGGIVKPLLRWYQKNARKLPWRENVSPYRTWISEIMLQQTRVEAVRGYFERFTAALPTIESLADADAERLLKLWEGLGYYSRARNLQKAAQKIMAEHGGALPASYAQLLELPGIGEYTAGAIASIAFGVARPAVDGNVLRVLSRVLGSFADIAQPQVKTAYRMAVQEILPEDSPGDFNQSLMELGAVVCLPNAPPLCARCPLQAFCAAFEGGFSSGLPVKAPKKERRVEQRTIVIMQANKKILLFQRETGLLSGMFEPLNIAGFLTEAEITAHIRMLGGRPEKLIPLGEAKHVFTHIRWDMRGFLAQTPAFNAENGYWADGNELLTRYPVPGAFRAFLSANGLTSPR